MTTADHEAQLARDYGLVDHPKLALLYSIAYDLGHAYGYAEVESYFERLAPLIQGTAMDNAQRASEGRA